jgi:hypothetical protein
MGSHFELQMRIEELARSLISFNLSHGANTPLDVSPEMLGVHKLSD